MKHDEKPKPASEVLGSITAKLGKKRYSLVLLKEQPTKNPKLNRQIEAGGESSS